MLTSRDFERVYQRIEDSFEFIAGWDPQDIFQDFKGDIDHWIKASEYLKRALGELDKIEEFR